MIDELRGYKIFIASPDDLYPMHRLIKKHVYIFNLSHAIEKRVIFIPFNHEDTPGGHSDDGVQCLINDEVSDRDYAVIMFGQKLGSPTQHYRSGTIEEYEESKRLKKEGKMINFLVLCKEPDKQECMNMPLEKLKEYTEARDYIKNTLEKEGNNCKPFDGECKIIEELNRFLNAELRKIGIVNTTEVTADDIKEPSEI